MPLAKQQRPVDENGPTITLPPPASTTDCDRSRVRPASDLPPHSTRISSSSPSRLSNFLPSLKSPTRSRTASPERISPAEAAEYELHDNENAARSRSGGVSRSIASWFEGSSDPVNIGLVPSPAKEKIDPVSEGTTDTMFSNSNSTESVDTYTTRPKTLSRPTSTSRFSFFRKQSTPNLTDADLDELASLDIRESLFPHGPADEYSPAAFKNLQLNAEGVLRRFQGAHIEQQKQIRSLTFTKTAQADDLEASQVRSEHLKLQLMEMAERASEQERLILALRNELAAISHPDSKAGFELEQSSVRKVPMNLDMSATYQTARSKRNRTSDMSSAGSSDTGDRHSIFSTDQRSLDHFMDSPGTSVAPSPVMKHASVMHITRVSPPSAEHEHAAISVVPVSECQKCHGVKASEAWDVVAMMKAESQALKEHIADLEGTNEQVLSMLGDLDLGLK